MTGSPPALSLDVDSPDLAPYFTWDAPVSNAAIRDALRAGSPDERLHWIARILREAKYDDISESPRCTRRLPRLD
jgi:hypothetical protein